MKKSLIIIPMIIVSNLSFGIEPIDGYYSNDLLGAVDEAKERPHHYDYSNTYRYKRTTAQSIHLNQINLNDLENTHLSMSNTNIDSKDNNQASKNLPLDNENFESIELSEQFITVPKSVLPKNTGTSISIMGELSSSGIINNTTIQSTPRP